MSPFDPDRSGKPAVMNCQWDALWELDRRSLPWLSALPEASASARPAPPRPRRRPTQRSSAPTVDVALVLRRGRLLFHGYGRTGPPAGRLCAGPRLAGIPQRPEARAQRPGAGGLCGMAGEHEQKLVLPWRLVDGPETARAVAGRDRRRAPPPGLSHLDLRRAHLLRASVRGHGSIAPCGRSSMSRATA